MRVWHRDHWHAYDVGPDGTERPGYGEIVALDPDEADALRNALLDDRPPRLDQGSGWASFDALAAFEEGVR